MRKLIFTLFAIAASVLTAKAQDASYKILHETDTTVKARIEGVSLGSRDVRYFVYEYPSVDPDKQTVTVSAIMMVPSAIVDGSTPCDGIVLFNHHTLGSPEQAPSVGGLDVPSALMANPLHPNYIVVMADYIGYGSSIDHPVAYLCGDTNARNSLDALLAAKQMLADRNIPQGKYLFNMGYSQGATESMYAAKLRDMEYKDKGITFTKTFVGGGMLDCEEAYSEFVKRDQCDAVNDVANFLISVNENCHLGIDYHDLFKEPVASNVQKFIQSKNKSDIGAGDIDSLHQLLQPAYFDLSSEPAKALAAKLAEIKISNGWEPDLTQQYYIEHSRHDNYVPVQCGRALLTWMRGKGFTPSLVPGKTSLQTNMLVFKLKHQPSAIVWAIQAMAAIQFWPVVYYEGEQNRYYHDVVKDMNLMKVVKILEGWGLDLRQLVQQQSAARSFGSDLEEEIAEGDIAPEGSVRQLSARQKASFFEILAKVTEVLAKVDLTLEDAYQMLDDSGITILDILEVVNYVTGASSAAPATGEASSATLSDRVEAPLYLLRLYEQTLANWLLLGGIDVQYDLWGWGR